MKSKIFFSSLLGCIIGIVFVKSFLLNMQEEIWFRTLWEMVAGNIFSSRASEIYLRNSGFPIGLFFKIVLGGILGGVAGGTLFSKMINDSKNMSHIPPSTISNNGTKKCPACAEYVKIEAKVCRFCNHDFTK